MSKGPRPIQARPVDPTSHPLSVKRAELIWEGKYDPDGKRVAPLRVSLPFQTVEMVNETAQERQKSLLFESPASYYAKEWRNHLIWGDKKYVLPSLVPEFAGKVNLIYIDPPFDTGADFSFTSSVPDHPDTEEDDSFAFVKDLSSAGQRLARFAENGELPGEYRWITHRRAQVRREGKDVCEQQRDSQLD